MIVLPIPFSERISIWACFSSKSVLQNDSSSIGISSVPPPKARSTRSGYIISILLFPFACLAAVFSAALSLGEVESFISLIRIAIGSLAIALSFSALSLALGAITQKFVIVGIIYHLVAEKLIGNLPTLASKISILRNLNFNLYSITVYNLELDQPEILFDYGHILIITIFALVLGTVASTSKKTQSVQSENPQGRSLRHPGMPICVLSKIARY